MKGPCDGCDVKRTLTEYDLSHRGPGGPVNLCSSCGDTLGIYDLMRSSEGKLMLKINSKLDILGRRKKES